jgi:hypothetical protein
MDAGKHPECLSRCMFVSPFRRMISMLRSRTDLLEQQSAYGFDEEDVLYLGGEFRLYSHLPNLRWAD